MRGRRCNEALQSHREGDDISPEAYLFASRKGGGRLSRVQAHRILKTAYEKASLTGKVTTHSMRKTVANTVYSATADLFVVKEILGHKNLSTTQQYLGVGIDKLQEAMDTLDECNFLHNTLHSEDKRQRGAIVTDVAKPSAQRKGSPRVRSHAPGMAPRKDQVQKSFQRRRNASKFSRRQKARAGVTR